MVSQRMLIVAIIMKNFYYESNPEIAKKLAVS